MSKDNTVCVHCGKGFDPLGSVQSRKGGHWIRATMRRGGRTTVVRGRVCCICVTRISNSQINQVMDGRLHPCMRIPFVPAAEM